MQNTNTDDKRTCLKAQEQICITCGRRFIIRRNSGTIPSRLPLPENCYECQKAKRAQQQKEKEERENRKWQQKKEREHQAYLAQLPRWDVVSRDSIQPVADRVLYIIGNGFDLMHGVRSSYSAFRDSLRKDSPLRFALENFWIPDDIWADFENALAQFNAEAMSSSFMVDTWLDTFDVYNEDTGAAEFFMAAEAAANPILTVVNELPRRLRMWVESLSIGTDDRLLCGMFRDGKVLCFNYTEFVESMYGVATDHVCYIHGCRRKKKYHPKDELIIGHLPGSGENSYDYEDKMPEWIRQPHKRYLVESAQAEVFRIISDCDEQLTKHSPEIIAKHQEFFDGLDKIKEIVVIGHSMSPVDWDYFDAVCSGLHDKNEVHWYFGCHGLRDLQNLECLLERLGLPRSSVSIFRTDDISVTPLTPTVEQKPKVKVRQINSDDKRWMVQMAGSSMEIVDRRANSVVYETAFPSAISNAFFASSSEFLFVIVRGLESGVLVFCHQSGCWRFVDELEGIPNQGVINRRLCHVFLREPEITFVYNNRIRVYNLCDGHLVKNQALHDARNRLYEGADVSRHFIRGMR